MKLTLCAVVLITILSYVSCLNILAMFVYHGKSHFFVFKELLKEIANRGHNLTVISYFPREDAPGNYHDISLADNYEPLGDFPLDSNYWTLINTVLFLGESGVQNCDVMMENSDVRKLIEQKPKFDVVLIEQFNTDCGLGVAHLLNAPIVGLTSHILMPWHYERFGVPHNPSFVPFHFLEGGFHPTFFQRIERFVFRAFCNYVYRTTLKQNDQTLAKYYEGIPPLEELAGNIKALLLYHNFVLTGSRLFPANVIEVGGYHIPKPKPLGGDLKKFIEESKHGVVYMSFGSYVKSSMLAKSKVQQILDAMEELPLRFIWKWEDDSLVYNKEKLFIAKWMPQADILGHPNVKAFVSHAGMLGTQEAVHYGVPILAIPILGDQPSNAAAIEDSGFGVQLQIRYLNKETFLQSLMKILNSEFHNRVKKLSAAWHDSPLSPMDTAIFWIEYVAKHPELNFITTAASVPFYQYFSLDIITFIFLLSFAVLYVLINLMNLCCRKKTVKKNKKE